MSLKWVDSMELYGSTLGNTVNTLPFLGRYDDVNLGSASIIAVGRIGGRAVLFSGNRFSTPSLGNHATWIIGFGFYNHSLPSASDTTIMELREGTTVHTLLKFRGDGTLALYRGDGTLLGGGSTVLTPLSWYFVEMKFTIDNSAGVAELLINEVSEISLSSQDTRNGGTANANNVSFRGTANSGQRWAIDDLYICNGAGSVNNDYLGDIIVEVITPNADGASSAWTPLSGTNFSCVANYDGLYVSTNTLNAIDLYAFTNLTRVQSDVKGVVGCTFARNSDSTTHTFAAVARQSSTNYVGTTTTIDSTAYTYYTQVWETNPDTSAAWSVSEVNAGEFGVKLLS